MAYWEKVRDKKIQELEHFKLVKQKAMFAIKIEYTSSNFEQLALQINWLGFVWCEQWSLKDQFTVFIYNFECVEAVLQRCSCK